MFPARSRYGGGLAYPLSLAVAALLAASGSGNAQEAGGITGTVVDGTNLQPLNGAQVVVDGMTRGASADARGRFLIPAVPAGTHTVRVTYLGYRTVGQEVTVEAGETAEVEIQLEVTAISLDEVVVTGAAGAVERRRLGVTVGSVDVTQLQEINPVESIGQVLQARVPSVRSVGTVGGVGAGRDLRIRGTSTFVLGQRPVVYIDGVRVDTNTSEWGGMGGTACCSFSGGAGEDRLGDLNPDEIDRVEVLKGAAASTLYGSEASNGVIQVFTKRGRSNSPPQFTLSSGVGFSRHRENFRTKLYPNFTGKDGFQPWDANEKLIENGLVTRHNLTAQGGGQDVTYFVSGGFDYNEGSIKPNDQNRTNLRVNLNWTASDKWTFGINTAYVRNNILALQSGNNWTALFGNAVLGNPLTATPERPYGEPWVTVEDIKAIETFSNTNRWTGSITAGFTPSQRFTHRVTMGIDNVTDQKERHMPYGHEYVYVGQEGEKNIGYRSANITTVDYLGTLRYNLGGPEQEFSFGAQGYWEEEVTSMAVGQGFAGPGVSTVGSASLFFADEDFNETINLGFFGRNRVSIQDKLFFSVAGRVDGHSSFGANFGLKAYPSADAAYVISEEGFLPEFVSMLKLRAGVGQAGLPPGAFDSFRTYSPVAVLDDVSGVTPQNPGNPDLKPETTTEIDVGFEAGLFDDRVGLEVSAYRAETRDALLDISFPPSRGYRPIEEQSQLQNVGKILNTGWEVALNMTMVNTPTFRWNSNVNMDGSRNEILDLGPSAQRDSLGNGRLGDHREGYSVGSVWGYEVEYDPETKSHIRSDTTVYKGDLLPTFNISWGNTLAFGSFRLYGLLSAEAGAVFNNGDRPYAIRQKAGDEYLATLDPKDPTTPTPATDSILDYWSLASAIDQRDNIRIQEVSLGYTLPETVAGPLGLGRTTLTLSGRNLYWWDDCNCMDPNIQYEPGNELSNSGFLATPLPREFVLMLRTNF